MDHMRSIQLNAVKHYQGIALDVISQIIGGKKKKEESGLVVKKNCE